MAGKDRISELPAHIFDNILGFLPIEEAARTVVLSIIWKDIWFSLTKLNFNHPFFCYIDKHFNAHGYHGTDATIAGLDVINKILKQHNGPIRKFVIHFAEDFELFKRSRLSEFGQWLLFLTRNGVEEIDLNFLMTGYTVPSGIFSCTTLKILDLSGVSFELINGHYVLPNVTSLSFEHVSFVPGNRLGCVVGLPMLENLSFDYCDDVPFNIVAPKLGSLTTKYCTSLGCYSVLDFLPPNLDLRSISTLEFDCDTMESLLNVEHLKVTIGGRSFIDLLQMCPKLCKLDISLELNFARASELMEKLLEELSSLTQTPKTLHTLKIRPFYGLEAEMQFIKVLLACFSRLEKVVIIPQRQFDFNKKFKIMQELLCFPRSSANAKIIYI